MEVRQMHILQPYMVNYSTLLGNYHKKKLKYRKKPPLLAINSTKYLVFGW